MGCSRLLACQTTSSCMKAKAQAAPATFEPAGGNNRYCASVNGSRSQQQRQQALLEPLYSWVPSGQVSHVSRPAGLVEQQVAALCRAAARRPTHLLRQQPPRLPLLRLQQQQEWQQPGMLAVAALPAALLSSPAAPTAFPGAPGADASGSLRAREHPAAVAALARLKLQLPLSRQQLPLLLLLPLLLVVVK